MIHHGRDTGYDYSDFPSKPLLRIIITILGTFINFTSTTDVSAISPVCNRQQKLSFYVEWLILYGTSLFSKFGTQHSPRRP